MYLRPDAGVGVAQVQGADGVAAAPGGCPHLIAGNLETVKAEILLDPGESGIHRGQAPGQDGAVHASEVIVGVGKLCPYFAARFQAADQRGATVGRGIPMVAVTQRQFQQPRTGVVQPQVAAPLPAEPHQVGSNILARLTPDIVVVPVHPYPPVRISHCSPSSQVYFAPSATSRVPGVHNQSLHPGREGRSLCPELDSGMALNLPQSHVVTAMALSCRNRASNRT